MSEQVTKQDRGFHASVPRMVRTGYKSGESKLTVTQKWVYVCLKDLCGDKGACYRSLRTLANETGVSTGILSKTIPLLDKVGLIHARQQIKGTWHITIANIWEQNGKLYPTKYLHCEQDGSDDEHTQPQTVHSVNATVHDMNTNAPDCSSNEQERSPRETKENVPGRTFSKDTNEGENSVNPSVSGEVIDQLRKWLEELGIEGSQNPAKVAADLAKVTLHVQSKNDLIALHTFEYNRLLKKYGEEKTVFLGNLASSAEWWAKSQKRTQITEVIPAPKTPIQEPQNSPGEDEIQALVRTIERYSSAIVVVVKNGSVGLKQDDSGVLIPVFDLDDWERMLKNNQSLLDQAVQYGQSRKERIA